MTAATHHHLLGLCPQIVKSQRAPLQSFLSFLPLLIEAGSQYKKESELGADRYWLTMSVASRAVCAVTGSNAFMVRLEWTLKTGNTAKAALRFETLPQCFTLCLPPKRAGATSRSCRSSFVPCLWVCELGCVTFTSPELQSALLDCFLIMMRSRYSRKLYHYGRWSRDRNAASIKSGHLRIWQGLNAMLQISLSLPHHSPRQLVHCDGK